MVKERKGGHTPFRNHSENSDYLGQSSKLNIRTFPKKNFGSKFEALALLTSVPSSLG